MPFFSKPKVLKDYRFYRDENFILMEESEGASFNPIRLSGCAHWFLLVVLPVLILTFVIWTIGMVDYIFKILMGVQT